MPRFPSYIPTMNLKLSDVPAESADLEIIDRFALTFDPQEKDPYTLEDHDLAKLSIDSSLIDLRSHLFFEQRRWNHYGREPDPAAVSAIKRIVRLIRAKLSRGEGAGGIGI